MGPKKPSVSEPRTRRRWSDEENKRILDHLLGVLRSGKEIEKPNATAFYKTALQLLKFEECTDSQLKNQVRNLKKKYGETIQWRDQTGQGVLLEEGEESVKSVILKRCPQFDKLDEIFGSKVSFSPPFLHDSGNTTNHNEDNNMESGRPADTSLEYFVDPDDGEQPPQSHIIPIDKIQTKTNSRKRPISSQSGLAMLAQTTELKIEMQKEQLGLEKEKWEYEKRQRDQHYQLDLQKLEQDKILAEKKLDLEEIKNQRDHELAKYKIDQEIKLSLELAKLKNV